MEDNGVPSVLNGKFYYRHIRFARDLYVWWMWHGPTGHWVINDTPGQHGDDRMMSVLADFQCPFDIDEWEGAAASHDFILKKSECCREVSWFQDQSCKFGEISSAQ
ncbi:unnamed protein product [Oikopleura dioica]|uniref:Uncharacterized protein n=1 Tax=Oikopleura dioica TaxID=34765 RepID=E4XV12_OIKDI|nr:unnamed protein product [Oikopleura dioica]